MDIKVFNVCFTELADKYFSFLTTDYDYKKKELTETNIEYVSQRCIINIFIGTGHELSANVTIKPILSSLKYSFLGVGVIAKYYAEPDCSIINIKNKNDLEQQLIYYSEILKKHCSKLISGDFSTWGNYESYVDKKI